MEFIAFSEETTKQFKSYLSFRKLKVHINNTFSEPGKFQHGVSQGSIFEAFIFLLYINDRQQTVECELLLYADDTCLIFQLKYIAETKIALNKDFRKPCVVFR